MRVYFPGYFTECHRTLERQLALAAELRTLGFELSAECPSFCTVAFCGSVWQYTKCCDLDMPVVHYSWDIYPFQLTSNHRIMWMEYLDELKRAAAVLVPTRSCIPRMLEYTGVMPIVVHPCVKVPSIGTYNDGWIVDVVRSYPDPNRDAVEKACKAAELRFKPTKAALPYDEYIRTIAGARLLVSAYIEASTGGLALLEGYALGKPVLISDSHLNGARELFGRRASYFGGSVSLEYAIGQHTPLPPPDCRAWVEAKYSDAAFAARLSEVLRGL